MVVINQTNKFHARLIVQYNSWAKRHNLRETNFPHSIRVAAFQKWSLKLPYLNITTPSLKNKFKVHQI